MVEGLQDLIPQDWLLTFIAAMMRISASVNLRHVAEVILNITECLVLYLRAILHRFAFASSPTSGRISDSWKRTDGFF